MLKLGQQNHKDIKDVLTSTDGYWQGTKNSTSQIIVLHHSVVL